MVKQLYEKRITTDMMKRSDRIDRLELMRTFVRIVDSGSLSAAALQMATTQATVSRRLQSLETLLNSKLLMRTTHAMKLTDAGERCYKHAKELIDRWLLLEDEIQVSSDEPVGVLRVRVPHAFGQQQLLTPLVTFLDRYTKLNVEWMLNDKSTDFISDNIDCAIRVGLEVDPATVSVRLAEVRRSLVCAPSLAMSLDNYDKPENLSLLPWIAVSTFYQHQVTLTHCVTRQTATFNISPRLSTDNLYAARNAALAGLGVAIVSSWTVEEDIREGRLVDLVPEWHAYSLPVHLVYPWARYYPARLRKFLDLMREVMPQIVGMNHSSEKYIK